jgi:hypothetical protein
LEVYLESRKAFQVLEHSQTTYLLSTIFVLRAQRAALTNIEQLMPMHRGFTESHNNLQSSTSVLGMTASQYIEGNLYFTQISALEIFFQTCLAAVLKSFPNKLGSTQFTLSQFLEVETKDELILRAVDGYLNSLMYKKPKEYLDDMCKQLSISSDHFIDLWPTFIEAKARRDVGIHNNWICNQVYLRKVAEAKLETNAKVGDSLMPEDENYFIHTVRKLGLLAESMLEAIRVAYF